METTKKRADPGPQKSFVAQVETMPVLAFKLIGILRVTCTHLHMVVQNLTESDNTKMRLEQVTSKYILQQLSEMGEREEIISVRQS